MIKIGLSGTRLSGKNKVSGIFKSIGIPVFDADLIIRFILAHEYKILAKIRDNVGHKYFKGGLLEPNLVEKNGVFDKIVDIIEPHLFEAYDSFQSKNKGSIYTVFNSSILFERKWDKKMNYNISVYSPFTHRVERAKKVKEFGFENITSINSILSKETDELTKNSLSDYVIHNYNEFDIQEHINKIDQEIIDTYLKKEKKLT
jgi:dephospho-CoA kinase